MPIFSSVYPYLVKLENHAFGNNDASLLYITNKINETSAFQKLKVSVLQQALGEYTFNGFNFQAPTTIASYVPATSVNAPTLAPANSTFKPDFGQYNLGIVIKNGVLEEKVLLSFSNILYTALQESLPSGTAAAIQGPFTSNRDHSLTWYCAFSQNIVTSTYLKWKAEPSNRPMVNISQTADGKLFGIGTDHNFYTNDLNIGTAWTKVETGGWQAFTGVALPNGQLRLVGLDHNLYNGGSGINSQYKLMPNCASTAFIAGMADNSLLGLNTTGDLLHMPTTATTWQSVDHSIPMERVFVACNNLIYGVGKDALAYEREGIQGTWRKITALPEIVVYQKVVGTERYGINCANNSLVSSRVENTTPVLNFELDGVSAAPGSGSRNTQIEFLFGAVSVGAETDTFSFKRAVSLDILNHQGQSYAPLQFGVVGDGELLNNSSKQPLTLYFQSFQNQNITFNANTTITFTFPCTESNAELVAFADASLVKAYTLTPDEAAYFDVLPNQSTGTIKIQYKGGASTAPLELNLDIFKFSNIQLSGTNGMAVIEVVVQNLPGYWDSIFQIPIKKTTQNISQQLELPTSNNNGRSATNGSRIDFMSEGKDKNEHYNLTIEANNGLNLYGTQPNMASTGAQGVPTSASEQKSGLPIRIKETDLLIPEGRLAINGGDDFPKPGSGDVNTNEKLNVTGDTFLNGHLGISKDLGIGGAVDVKGDFTATGSATVNGATRIANNNLRIDGTTASSDVALSVGGNGAIKFDAPGIVAGRLNLTSQGDLGIGQVNPQSKLDVNGRIQDQTGPVMPVGSVIAYAGKTAPQGWLMCDGQSIPNQFADLITVVGKNTPNLCGRTIIGAGTNYVNNTDGSQSNLGELKSPALYTMKGSTTHHMSLQEMPSHQHFGWGEDPGTNNNWGLNEGAVNNSTGRSIFPGYIGSKSTDCNNTLYGSTFTGGHSAGIDVDNGSITGGKRESNDPHNNMQPYTVLNYIIKC